VGPHLIEVAPPGFQLGAGVRQGAEQGLVQQFVAQLAIEALAEAVLLGLSGSDVMPADLVLVGPFQDGVGRQFRAVVADDRRRLAAPADDRVQLAREVIKPPGDAKQDLWIIQEIARRMGLPWNYSGPADVFTEMTEVMPSLKNITWERLVREGAVTYPVDDPDKPGNEIIFTTGFPTASGRGKIVPARVLPPDELPDTEYPMVLSTGRVLEHWHTGSMTRRSSVLDQIEPEAVAFMSPKDMRRLKVWPGDFVRLETRRGAVEVKVRSDRDVPENMVFMPFCYAEAAANLLTNPALDPFGKIPEFKFCAVRAERAEISNAAE